MISLAPIVVFARRLRVAGCSAALLAAVLPLHAQSSAPAAASTSATAAPVEEVVKLSKFEVVTTQGTGYIANNTATGFKTNQQLIQIPQFVQVLTRDLITDIGATKTSDVLMVAGVSQFYRGESIRMRGARTLNPYLDDSIENVPYSDNVNIDAYEVIRGPAGVLYPNASVGGIALKSTKKPLPYSMQSLNFSIKDWGQIRGEVDSTGPVGQLGDAKVGYRFAGAFQDGGAYFKNVDDRRVSVHPSLQVQFKDTTIRAGVDFTDLHQIAGGQNFVLPDGTLYTGAGRKEAYYAKGIMEEHKQLRERVAILHRFSQNWESKTSLSHLFYERHGTNLLPNDLNLATGLFTLFARRNYQRMDNWVVNQDVLGTYHIGGLENQSAMGFTITDEYNRAAFLNANGATTGSITAPLFNNALGRISFPIASPNLDSVVVPTYESYGPPSAVGSWTNNRRSTYYYQHQLTVVPNHLILVGGVSKATLQINDVPAIVARNTAGGTRIVNFDETLHRIGVVVNITKDIAVYALDSTTFAPQGNSNTRDINGILLPAQVGKGKEIGLKTALMDGKLSATIASYKLDLTNVAVLQGGLSPITGQAFFIPAGVQTQKGWDATVTFSPVPQWQLLVNAYTGTVKDQTGADINNTYGNLFSFFTRYDLDKDGLKGLAIGGGASKTGKNVFTSLGGYTFPTGVAPHPITLEAAWNASMFVSWKYDKHWTFRMNIENLLDKAFALGAQTPIFVDPSPPRTFQFSSNYKF